MQIEGVRTQTCPVVRGGEGESADILGTCRSLTAYPILSKFGKISMWKTNLHYHYLCHHFSLGQKSSMAAVSFVKKGSGGQSWYRELLLTDTWPVTK